MPSTEVMRRVCAAAGATCPDEITGPSGMCVSGERIWTDEIALRTPHRKDRTRCQTDDVLRDTSDDQLMKTMARIVLDLPLQVGSHRGIVFGPKLLK
jgi:hypothetical protein